MCQRQPLLRFQVLKCLRKMPWQMPTQGSAHYRSRYPTYGCGIRFHLQGQTTTLCTEPDSIPTLMPQTACYPPTCRHGLVRGQLL
mmetsp:Transcript_84159/g.233235  ORF Transcript_84159/g.233235 Transcript_84159/m.233235 type:complete len:85 (-) Transcript_84159:177-431(-)